jgi:hypothetical protein
MSFRAALLSAGQGGHAAIVPPEVASGFTSKRPRVVAQVNGVEYRSRLMVYGGKTFLGLRKDLLRTLGVAIGDELEIELVEDDEDPVVAEPAELVAALEANPAARAAYDALAFTHRQEYARWISEAKRPQTREDRIGKTLRRLSG